MLTPQSDNRFHLSLFKKKKTKDERSTFFLLRLKLNTTVISERQTCQTSISILKTFLTKKKLSRVSESKLCNEFTSEMFGKKLTEQ